MTAAEILEIKPSGPATHACIVLHGLGATGSDLFPLAPHIWNNPGVHWLFPTAPVRPITINGGMPTNGWYDVSAIRLLEQEDRAGIEASAAQINALIDTQIASGIPAHKIVLVGFSQGAAMTLHVGIRQAQPLGALVALSGYLPLHQDLAVDTSTATATPIFIGAGEEDPIIAMTDTLESGKLLTEKGFSVTAKVYAMGHEIVPQEIHDIADFLAQLDAT